MTTMVGRSITRVRALTFMSATLTPTTIGRNTEHRVTVAHERSMTSHAVFATASIANTTASQALHERLQPAATLKARLEFATAVRVHRQHQTMQTHPAAAPA